MALPHYSCIREGETPQSKYTTWREDFPGDESSLPLIDHYRRTFLTRQEGNTMSQDGTPSVLIIGAAPTGMTAAIELARFGIEVRIIEKTHEPATTSRAVGVQARTLELMEQRGL